MKVCGCGMKTSEYVEFPCPNCGSRKIVRCKKCRKQGNKYECTEKGCGFIGP